MKKLLYILITSSLFFTACDIKEEGVSDEKILKITTPYGDQLITGYDVPLAAKDLAGNDLTSSAVFYIDGQSQSSNTVRFSQAGSYQITASVTLDGQTITSQPYVVNVIEPRHSTKILIEDYTGTWCTNCPRVAYKLDQAVSQNNHIIPVAIHYSRWAGDDPFGFDDATTLLSDYNISGLPSPVVNRVKGFIWDEQYSTLQTELDKTQPLGLAITSNINGNEINIDVMVRFDMDMSQKNLSLVVYLTENGLHADQANATNYYGGQDPIPDFEQNHTLRAALNNLYGTGLPANETKANQTYNYHLNTPIPGNISNISNCEIVAFILEGSQQDARLINIQKAAVGNSQDFD